MNIFWDYDKLSEKEKIRENKKLIKKYPFLLPKNVWTGEVLDNYNYSWTFLDDVPKGWRISIMPLFLEDLRKELIKYNYLDKYSITQIKEKFGELRWYDAGSPAESKVDDIIEIYSLLSSNICIECGKPDVPMINDSWISPYCENCWIRSELQRANMSHKNIASISIVKDAKESYNELADKHCKLSTEYKYTRFSKEGKKEIVIDISKEVNRIRKNWDKYLRYIKS